MQYKPLAKYLFGLRSLAYTILHGWKQHNPSPEGLQYVQNLSV